LLRHKIIIPFLDETTQHALNRGSRLIELLKQRQYKPLNVESQVVVIYAGMRGFLDQLDVLQVEPFKNFLLKAIIISNFEKSINVFEKLNTCLIDSFLESTYSQFKTYQK
jgi:F0F1-type ATP synthase alpha subunit